MAVGSGETSGDGSGSLTTETPTSETPDRPPVLISHNSNFLLINPATSARFFVNVTFDAGSPPGLLMWRHNGSIISSRTDPRVTILARGGLTIRNVKFSDSGMYTVTVSNRVGERSINYSVAFQCKLSTLVNTCLPNVENFKV